MINLVLNNLIYSRLSLVTLPTRPRIKVTSIKETEVLALLGSLSLATSQILALCLTSQTGITYYLDESDANQFYSVPLSAEELSFFEVTAERLVFYTGTPCEFSSTILCQSVNCTKSLGCVSAG